MNTLLAGAVELVNYEPQANLLYLTLSWIGIVVLVFIGVAVRVRRGAFSRNRGVTETY